MLIASTDWDGKNHLLLAYIPEDNHIRYNRFGLKAALDSFIALQEKYWDTDNSCIDFQSRTIKCKYLGSDVLDKVCDAYLEDYRRIPATFCHDHLLSFNVITSQNCTAFIN